MEQYYGTGRRKTSTARVFLRPGQGNYKVNGKTADQYFLTPTRRSQVKLPLQVAELAEKFKFARQKSALAGVIRGTFFVIKGKY